MKASCSAGPAAAGFCGRGAWIDQPLACNASQHGRRAWGGGRVRAEGPLVAIGPWEMVVVRALLRRGLLRRKDPDREGRHDPGPWFLTDAGIRATPVRRARDV